jgi:peptide chain release factor 3
MDSNQSAIANDHDGDPVFLARNHWHLSDAQDKNPDIKFLSTK